MSVMRAQLERMQVLEIELLVDVISHSNGYLSASLNIAAVASKRGLGKSTFYELRSRLLEKGWLAKSTHYASPDFALVTANGLRIASEAEKPLNRRQRHRDHMLIILYELTDADFTNSSIRKSDVIQSSGLRTSEAEAALLYLRDGQYVRYGDDADENCVVKITSTGIHAAERIEAARTNTGKEKEAAKPQSPPCQAPKGSDETNGAEKAQAPEPSTTNVTNSLKVFVVHGQDEEMKQAVARTLSILGLEPVVLHEKPSQGRTIIEKFAAYAEVSFAVVLLSPDDIARPRDADSAEEMFRARQNVILEMGYFLGKLGRQHVLVLHRMADKFEMPSEYSGVLLVPYDQPGKWRFDLAKELRACGYDIDANKLM